MSPPLPRARLIAARLVERETAGRDTPEALALAIDRLLGELFGVLATVIGAIGFRAVLIRAIHLTRATIPWLDKTDLVLEGTLRWEGLVQVIEREGPDEVRAASEALLANLLMLLFSFIGEDLTCRLVRRIWPELPDSEPS